MKKKKIVTILIVIATIVLAGVAVFTAIRLYQLRQESVSPAAPTSQPAAAETTIESCSTLAFTLTTPTGSPTATPSDSPTATPTGSPTATPSDSPTATPTSTATATATATSATTAEPELPDAGVAYPTIIGGAAGILLILISLALAL